VTQFRVRHDTVKGAAWLISACGVAQLGCGVNQYRVRCSSDEGCDMAQLRMGRGLVRVQPWLSKGAAWLSRVQRGSVRVRRGSVQCAVWLRSGCGETQYRVLRW
jgi:hypothetical protein